VQYACTVFVDVNVVDLSFKGIAVVMMTQGKWSNKYDKADGNDKNPDTGQWWQLPFMRYYPFDLSLPACLYLMTNCSRMELQIY
jgi:hypothetical protein